MTPIELGEALGRIVDEDLRLSVMIWGPPGVGKSSVVAQLCTQRELELVDVRLSQLAPTDLRGLPVPKDGVATWYPPEFLPRTGSGVLFLDELNLAPPAIQGIAQQLILDRRVGSYVVPERWFVWAAGNRKEDRAAVFDMPAPLSNRFVHFGVQPDLSAFRRYAAERGISERIVSFLSFRPDLLHRMDPGRAAWPSPRSWEMASALIDAGIPVQAAVGEAAGSEYDAYGKIYDQLVDIDGVLAGAGTDVKFPREASQRYAVTVALGLRSASVDEAMIALAWLLERADAEWVQLLWSLVSTKLRAAGKFGAFAERASNDAAMSEFMDRFSKLLSS